MIKYIIKIVFILLLVNSISFAQYYQLMPKVGGINWTEQVVRSTGLGSPNPNMPPGSRRAGAIEAAKMAARKNMLAVISGISVNANATISDLMAGDADFEAEIENIARNFRIIDTRYMQTGAIEVDVEVPLSALYAVLPASEYEMPTGKYVQIPSQQQFHGQQPQTSGTSNAFKQRSVTPSDPAGGLSSLGLGQTGGSSGSLDSGYTGLIIDARGLSITPALAPSLIDENGHIVYASGSLSGGMMSETGMVIYERDMNRADDNILVSGRPLIITAVRADGATGSDIILRNADADKVWQSLVNFNFLAQGKVLIVIN